MALTFIKANQLLTYLNGQAGEVYIGLSTTTPTMSGGYTEPDSSAGYKRVRLQSSQMTTPSEGLTYNKETLYFAEAVGDWGTCTYFCLFSSASPRADGSDLIAYGLMNPAINPTSGKVPLLRAGNLQMSMS